jgi:hypothetical protein
VSKRERERGTANARHIHCSRLGCAGSDRMILSSFSKQCTSCSMLVASVSTLTAQLQPTVATKHMTRQDEIERDGGCEREREIPLIRHE